jgi:hypothetical protein
MPTATARAVRETREMRLLSRVIRDAGKGDLPLFLAIRRQPGAHWRSWEQIAFDLHGVTDELITREGIRRWARKYGIPENTTREDGPKLATAYRTAVKRAGIEI